MTANLRVGNRIASEILGESLLAGAASPVELRRASDAAALAALPRIDRFEVGPVESLDAGSDLVFTLSGSAGAKASVRINGVKGKFALDEVSAGKYEGIYTIKSRDRVSAASAATASLRAGERESTAVLGGSLLGLPENMPSTRRERAAKQCANCGVVESINVVEVNGDGFYVGKIAGGLAGVVIGSQIGSGRGTTAAQIAGAIGGAVAGNEIEKRVRKVRHYEVTARLQGGRSAGLPANRWRL